jgi:hypothetical protein
LRALAETRASLEARIDSLRQSGADGAVLAALEAELAHLLPAAPSCRLESVVEAYMPSVRVGQSETRTPLPEALVDVDDGAGQRDGLVYPGVASIRAAQKRAAAAVLDAFVMSVN